MTQCPQHELMCRLGLQSLRLQFGHLFGATVTSMQALFREIDKLEMVNVILQALRLLT